MGFKLSVTNCKRKSQTFWTKDTIGHLGVGIHIYYGDIKWDNPSVSCFYCITPERFQLLSQL